jgi:HEAT repeat protein
MNTRFLAALSSILAFGRICFAVGEATPGQLRASSEVSALVGELQTDNALDRVRAARALVAVGPSAAPALAQAMRQRPSEKTAPAMIDAFVGLGSDAVPMMLALIRTEQSWELRRNPGLNGILKMGTNALPGLEAALRSPDWETRGCVIDSLRLLQGVSDSQKTCVRLLIEEAKGDPEEKLRVYATDALGYSGLWGRHSAPPEGRDGLHELLKQKSQKVRITAAYSLAKAYQESSPEVLAGLLEGLKQSDGELAYDCVFAMNFLETNAAPALPELSKALQRGDERIALEAANVLAKLGDPGFTPLSAATADSNPRVRLNGLNALADLVINSTNHLEASLVILAKALKFPDNDTKQAALNSLRRIGVERRDAVLAQRIMGTITPLTNGGDQWVRSSAEDALKELGQVRQQGGADRGSLNE